MSKSLNNVISIPDIIEHGFDPLDLRYYLLSVHYRTNLKFSWRGMEDAQKARHKVLEWMQEGEEYVDRLSEGGIKDLTTAEIPADGFTAQFTAAMDSDLNTPGALSILFDAMKWCRNQSSFTAAQVLDVQMLIDAARHTFGCFEPEKNQSIPEDVQALIREREEARAQKNFAESDRLRDDIQKRGFTVKDTAEGQKLKAL